MKKRAKVVCLSIIATLVALAAGCKASDDRVYTLYRSSVLDSAMRIHVATFDADEKEKYNKENCEIAQGLFQQQPHVSVRYWCEKGHYRE